MFLGLTLLKDDLLKNLSNSVTKLKIANVVVW